MKDINLIETAMLDALMSMYHSREIKPIASSPGDEKTPVNGEEENDSMTRGNRIAADGS
jgi:hypothetical protein